MLCNGLNRRLNTCRNGAVMIYMIATMIGFIGICSFAVDYGRVQLAKAQLHGAADAATLAAAGSLRDGTTAARRQAIDYIKANVPDELKDAVAAGATITFGYWGDPSELTSANDDADLSDADVDEDAPDEAESPDATSVFTALSAGDRRVNAVKVELERTAENRAAVQMIYASLFGKETCDVHASAIAVGYTRTAGDGFVGIKQVRFQKQASTDSYMSDWGGYGSAAVRPHGSLKTNGRLKLKKDVTIDGDAQPGVNQPATSGGTVAGSREPLTYLLSYPPVEQLPKSPSPAPSHGDFQIGHHSTYTLSEGTYRYDDFRIEKDATLNLVGQVTLIIDGKFEMKGVIMTFQDNPANLRIRVTGKKEARIGKDLSLYADIYAPRGKVRMDKGANVYGSLIANEVRIGEAATLHYDESLFTQYAAATLVK